MCLTPRGSNNHTMSIDNTLPIGAYLLLEPDGGERLRFLGDSQMRLKIDGGDSGDALCFTLRLATRSDRTSAAHPSWP